MAVDHTLDLDQLEQLSTIYNNLLNRDRPTKFGIDSLDLLEELVYNEVLKHHDIVYPPEPEPKPETETQEEQ